MRRSGSRATDEDAQVLLSSEDLIGPCQQPAHGAHALGPAPYEFLERSPEIAAGNALLLVVVVPKRVVNLEPRCRKCLGEGSVARVHGGCDALDGRVHSCKRLGRAKGQLPQVMLCRTVILSGHVDDGSSDLCAPPFAGRPMSPRVHPPVGARMRVSGTAAPTPHVNVTECSVALGVEDSDAGPGDLRLHSLIRCGGMVDSASSRASIAARVSSGSVFQARISPSSDFGTRMTCRHVPTNAHDAMSGPRDQAARRWSPRGSYRRGPLAAGPSSGPAHQVDTKGMRTALSIFLAASLVAASTNWLGKDANWTAWRELEACASQLRPWVASAEFAREMDARAEACQRRMSELDEALEDRASSSDGIGATWMWKPSHRQELLELVRDVSPLLDVLAQLARERRGLPPIPVMPRLGPTRHRTNLFCAAAIVTSDDALARQRFLEAWEVATLEDDGGDWALQIECCAAGIIAEAVRLRAERLGREDTVLEAELREAYGKRFTCEIELERAARSLVAAVARADRGTVELWVLRSQIRDAQELLGVLGGRIDREEFVRRIQGSGHFWLGIGFCPPETAAAIHKRLDL